MIMYIIHFQLIKFIDFSDFFLSFHIFCIYYVHNAPCYSGVCREMNGTFFAANILKCKRELVSTIKSNYSKILLILGIDAMLCIVYIKIDP